MKLKSLWRRLDCEFLERDDVAILLVPRPALSNLPIIPELNELLCAAEREQLQKLGALKAQEYALSRCAARLLLDQLGYTEVRCLPHPEGFGLVARLDERVIGVSHSRSLIGVASRIGGQTSRDGVGFDLQDMRRLRHALSPRLLGAAELKRLGTLTQAQEIALFSAKEAVYKFLSVCGETVQSWKDMECLEQSSNRISFIARTVSGAQLPIICKQEVVRENFLSFV